MNDTFLKLGIYKDTFNVIYIHSNGDVIKEQMKEHIQNMDYVKEFKKFLCLN